MHPRIELQGQRDARFKNASIGVYASRLSKSSLMQPWQHAATSAHVTKNCNRTARGGVDPPGTRAFRQGERLKFDPEAGSRTQDGSNCMRWIWSISLTFCTYLQMRDQKPAPDRWVRRGPSPGLRITTPVSLVFWERLPSLSGTASRVRGTQAVAS
jgi:hypothetical protein